MMRQLLLGLFLLGWAGGALAAPQTAVVDPSGTPQARVETTAPGSSDAGMVVRCIGCAGSTGATVTANQGTPNAGGASAWPVTDATTHTDLSTINTTLGSPFQAGGSVGNTGFNALQGGTANAVGNPFYVSPATGTVWPLSSTTPVQTTALASNLVVCASACVLSDFEVNVDTTLSASTWYLMIFNATSLPGDGAVAPVKCYAEPAGKTQDGATFGNGGISLSTGAVIGVSTTGCYTKTASVHATFVGASHL
jgi:hypothetical protein